LTTTHTGQIAALQTTTATHTTQIGALQTASTTQAGQIVAIQTLDTTQNQRLTGVESTNTAQDTQIVALQAGAATQANQISAIQVLDATQSAQIASLQSQLNTSFDLSKQNQRDVGRATEGVAMALAMESPALPPGTNFAVSGGVGYFNNAAAVTTAVTRRVGPNASVSAGVGYGFRTKQVGARGGFQIAW
jgi:hypothetical protein